MRPAALYWKTIRLLGVVPDTVPLPTIASLSPNSGLPTGGTAVTVTGANFEYPPTKLAAYFAQRVLFDGIDATNVVVTSPTTLTCLTPAHAAATVAVRVMSPGGSSVKDQAFTYAMNAPTVSSVSPTPGSTAGGVPVTISGSHLTGATSVTFGGVAATSVVVVNDSTITCNTPANAAGAVSVIVTTPGGSNAPNTDYTYANPAPSSVAASHGTTAGGTAVTISGLYFTGATGATLGGTAVTSFVVVNDTTITCHTPAHVHGAVTLVVTNPTSSGNLASAYTFDTIVVSSFANTIDSGAVGDIDGGYAGTLTGSGFTGASGVTVGGNACTGVSVVNDTTITLTMPAHASGSGQTCTVTTAGDSGTGATYEFFSPAQLSLSGYWRGYTGSAPWAATATAGASATTGSLVTGGSDPSAGTALNGHGVAHFDGAANLLENGTTASGNVWSTTGGFIIALVKMNSESAPTGNYYDDPPIIEDTNYDLGLTVSTSGAAGFGYDGAYEITTPKALATGAFHMPMVRWNGTTIGVSVDGGAENTQALTTITVLNGTLMVGQWAGGAHFAAMDLVELLTSTATITNANRDKVRAYFRTRYNLSGI